MVEPVLLAMLLVRPIAASAKGGGVLLFNCRHWAAKSERGVVLARHDSS